MPPLLIGRLRNVKKPPASRSSATFPAPTLADIRSPHAPRSLWTCCPHRPLCRIHCADRLQAS